MSLRKDIDAVLNGLVRQGVITSFQTTDGVTAALGVLHVSVTAPVLTDIRNPGYDRAKVMAIRNRVTKELEGVGGTDVIVSVRSSLA
jgi:hypothetical protein